MKLSPISLVAIPLALVFGQATAQAEEIDGDVYQVHVPHGDLNLASLDGQNTLKLRVEAAVREVCRAPYGMGLKGPLLVQQCRFKASRDAEQQMASLFRDNGSRLADSGQVIVAAR